MIPDVTINEALWSDWRDACLGLGVPVTDEVQEQLSRFYDLLIATNRQYNLTRITEPEDFLYRHLLDSLTISPVIPQGATVMDIGSGPGFPSIPLAIVRPDVKVMAVESSEKKCRFMDAVRTGLKLDNLAVLCERSETIGRMPEYRDRLDIVTARAVAALPVLLELCLPLLRKDGLFLAMKGRSCEEELGRSKKAMALLGATVKELRTFDHPRLEGSRLLILERTKATPLMYPRLPGVPGKSPL